MTSESFDYIQLSDEHAVLRQPASKWGNRGGDTVRFCFTGELFVKAPDREAGRASAATPAGRWGPAGVQPPTPHVAIAGHARHHCRRAAPRRAGRRHRPRLPPPPVNTMAKKPAWHNRPRLPSLPRPRPRSVAARNRRHPRLQTPAPHPPGTSTTISTSPYCLNRPPPPPPPPPGGRR